jgi:uncharacterized cupredoxin-like copper-binding protein
MNKPYLIFVIVLLWILTACGVGQPATIIKVNMIDFVYNPDDFVVPAGREITLDIVNNGAVEHNFIIMKAGTTVGPHFDEGDQMNVLWNIELAPGQRTTAAFTAPSEPGEYLIICSTEGHYEAGMTGKLVVVVEEAADQ